VDDYAARVLEVRRKAAGCTGEYQGREVAEAERAR
jgi:hypothetical protein